MKYLALLLLYSNVCFAWKQDYDYRTIYLNENECKDGNVVMVDEPLDHSELYWPDLYHARLGFVVRGSSLGEGYTDGQLNLYNTIHELVSIINGLNAHLFCSTLSMRNLFWGEKMNKRQMN